MYISVQCVNIDIPLQLVLSISYLRNSSLLKVICYPLLATRHLKKFIVSSYQCGILVPLPGIILCPLHWKCSVLNTRH